LSFGPVSLPWFSSGFDFWIFVIANHSGPELFGYFLPGFKLAASVRNLSKLGDPCSAKKEVFA
jgi:hypothetical protein